jgi:hypothetical protein
LRALRFLYIGAFDYVQECVARDNTVRIVGIQLALSAGFATARRKARGTLDHLATLQAANAVMHT